MATKKLYEFPTQQNLHRPAKYYHGILALTLWILGGMQSVVAAGTPPLHKIVQQDDMAVLQKTLSANDNLDVRDENGRTALTFATEQGNSEAVQLLLDVGASPDVNDFLGHAPLHFAVKSPVEITRMLIDAGADVDIRNSGGVTPLMQAAGQGRRDIVKLLLGAGARIDYKDYQGNSAKDWAKRSGDTQLTAMLARRLKSLPAEKEETSSGDNFAEDVFVDVHFPQWFQPSFLDFREDLQESVAGGKQGILLFLSTRRCSYCKAFIDKVLEIPEVRQRVQHSFDVIGLEIFDDSEMIDPAGNNYRVREFVTANKASFTPTLIFYGADGNKLLKIVGYYPPEKFRRVLDYLEGHHYQREPLRKYLARTIAAAEADKSPIIADDKLFSRPPYMLDRSVFAAQNPLMVVFETPHCTSCERFHKRVLSDKSIRRLMSEYENVQLDASDTSSRIKTPDGKLMTPAQWYEKLDLSYSPAIVFFDENGKEAMRLDSETQRFRMEGTLQLVLEGAYREDAQLQRWRWKKASQVLNQNQKQ
jgi:thioredoxin-related protein